MSEMRRLLDSEMDELGDELLRSALDDGPRAGSRERLLVSLGVGGATMLAATTAQAVAGAAASGTTAAAVGGAAGAAAQGGASITALAVTKWIGIGVVAGAVTTGAVTGVSELAKESPAGVAPPPVTQPADTAARAPAIKRSKPFGGAVEAQPEERPAQPEPPSPASAPAASPSVASEVMVLDRAREALRRGDPRRAMRALDQHESKFQEGALTEEAELLRIEALLEQRKPAQAAARARAFMSAHPRSPHLARVRSLLGRAQPTAAPNVARFPEEE